MKRLNFKIIIGYNTKDVELSQIRGADDSYQLYVDRFYYGEVVKRNGIWKAYLNDKAIEELIIDDIQAMGERIEQSN